MAGTAGFVLLVPSLLRSLDGFRVDVTTGALAFAGTAFGASGLLLMPVEMQGATRFVSAAALGLAAGAIHPEALNAIRRRRGAAEGEDDRTVETAQAAES